jgi:hypothetical protein
MTTPAAWLQVGWQRRDRHRPITVLAFVGVTSAVALAVFGLPPVDLHAPFHRFGVHGPAVRRGAPAARADLLMAGT